MVIFDVLLQLLAPQHFEMKNQVAIIFNRPHGGSRMNSIAYCIGNIANIL